MSSKLRLATDGRTPLRLRSGATALLVVSLFTGACATSSAVRRGNDAERRQDFDFAVVEYTKAVRLSPDDANARLALERAKVRASQDHFNRGRRFAAAGRLDQALVEFETASELNPSSNDVEEELRTTRNKLRAKVAVSREGKTELQTIIERARDLPPPGLDLPQGVKMPQRLVRYPGKRHDIERLVFIREDK